jgi:hypothetical protein
MKIVTAVYVNVEQQIVLMLKLVTLPLLVLITIVEPAIFHVTLMELHKNVLNALYSNIALKPNPFVTIMLAADVLKMLNVQRLMLI